MSLSQTQIIRSLGEALQWLEKELAWGAPIQELRHLTGRIGELYTAMITRGQMATAVNQRGYDVVSADGERISVKTITTTSNITFRKSTFDQVMRVVILRINLDEGEPSIEELLDEPAAEAVKRMSDAGDTYMYYVGSSRNPRTALDIGELKEVASSIWNGFRVAQLENGTITLSHHGNPLSPAKPHLREIARSVGVDVLNSMGNAKNTRSLGSDIIKALGSTETLLTSPRD